MHRLGTLARHCATGSTDQLIRQPSQLLNFWFGSTVEPLWDCASNPPQDCLDRWWGGAAELDRYITSEYCQDLLSCTDDLYAHPWSQHGGPRGRLALIILLDQFSRNIFRGSPKAFAYDPAALKLAETMHNAGEHEGFKPFERFFLSMPFEHSEENRCQSISVALREQLFIESKCDRAKKYLRNSWQRQIKRAAIIERFGRYPPRNSSLGRVSTLEEEEYLKRRARAIAQTDGTKHHTGTTVHPDNVLF